MTVYEINPKFKNLIRQLKEKNDPVCTEAAEVIEAVIRFNIAFGEMMLHMIDAVEGKGDITDPTAIEARKKLEDAKSNLRRVGGTI